MQVGFSMLEVGSISPKNTKVSCDTNHISANPADRRRSAQRRVGREQLRPLCSVF